MPLENFERHFKRDPQINPAPWSGVGSGSPPVDLLLGEYAGASFNRGIYRIMSVPISAAAKEALSIAFPQVSMSAQPFAYDWLGRIFFGNFMALQDGCPLVVRADFESGETVRAPRNIREFHEIDLVQSTEACLAEEAHSDWISQSGAWPQASECVGYKVPLFLGGEDDFDNMQIQLVTVHWAITAQAFARTKHLPPGIKVKFRI